MGSEDRSREVLGLDTAGSRAVSCTADVVSVKMAGPESQTSMVSSSIRHALSYVKAREGIREGSKGSGGERPNTFGSIGGEGQR